MVLGGTLHTTHYRTPTEATIFSLILRQQTASRAFASSSPSGPIPCLVRANVRECVRGFKDWALSRQTLRFDSLRPTHLTLPQGFFLLHNGIIKYVVVLRSAKAQNSSDGSMRSDKPKVPDTNRSNLTAPLLILRTANVLDMTKTVMYVLILCIKVV